jgi:hypothetical protein
MRPKRPYKAKPPIFKVGAYFIAIVILYTSQSAFNPAMGQVTVDYQSDSASSETEQALSEQNIIAPYISTKKKWEHLLALPAHLFDVVTFPLCWSVKVAERNLSFLIRGERGPYGIYPLFELGGISGRAVGLLGFHNKFTSANHKIRLEVLFGSWRYNNFDIDYSIPGFLTDDTTISFKAQHKNNPTVSLYGGNSSGITDKLIYATEVRGGSLRIKKTVDEKNELFGFNRILSG